MLVQLADAVSEHERRARLPITTALHPAPDHWLAVIKLAALVACNSSSSATPRICQPAVRSPARSPCRVTPAPVADVILPHGPDGDG